MKTLTGKQHDTMTGKHTMQRIRPERARGTRRNCMNSAQKHGMLHIATLHVHSRPHGVQQEAER